MELKQHVLLMEPRLLACLQENMRIPSVQGTPQEGAPYGVEVRRSLDHVLATARELGFRTVNVDNHLGWCEYGGGEENGGRSGPSGCGSRRRWLELRPLER